MSDQNDYWNSLAAHPLDASVIDPNDTKGRKNAYLASIRDKAILNMLGYARTGDVALDLGCGTGSLSAALSRRGWLVAGLDISMGLLRRTPERKLGEKGMFSIYDGARFPVRDASVQAVCTYVVLSHVLDPGQLAEVLAECLRVLKPGGRMISIEQVRRAPRLDRAGWKLQRTVEDYETTFSRAGFELSRAAPLRFGRFPTTHLIRLGLVPTALWSAAAAIERSIVSRIGVPRSDYCDVLFMATKPAG